MSYIDGFVIAVPTANKQKFIDHARTIDTMFTDYGALRVIECWGEDVPAGKVTDFPMAVGAQPDETVAFSWIEWSDKAARDAAMAKINDPENTDPRMDQQGNPMPFDGMRMIYGGFEPIFEAGEWTPGAYVQGFIMPVSDREAYRKMAAEAWDMFAGYGALQVAECFQDDVPTGKQTDFFRAVKAEPGESIVFSWMTWPSRAVCDAAAEKMQSDDAMKMPEVMPFDPQRMVFAGFVPVVELKGG